MGLFFYFRDFAFAILPLSTANLKAYVESLYSSEPSTRGTIGVGVTEPSKTVAEFLAMFVYLSTRYKTAYGMPEPLGSNT